MAGVLAVSFGAKRRVDGLGDGLGGVADAAGARWGSLAGRVRAEELAAGHIAHALFITVECVKDAQAVYPADTRRVGAGQLCRALGLRDEDAPPLGMHLQLRLSPEEIQALCVHPWQATLLHAMAEYGMYIGDTGARGWELPKGRS